MCRAFNEFGTDHRGTPSRSLKIDSQTAKPGSTNSHSLPLLIDLQRGNPQGGICDQSALARKTGSPNGEPV